MIVGARLYMNGEVFLAHPAPFVFADLAYHVWAAALLFYFDTAIGALADIFRIRLCPFIIAFFYLSLARFSRMPNV